MSFPPMFMLSIMKIHERYMNDVRMMRDARTITVAWQYPHHKITIR